MLIPAQHSSIPCTALVLLTAIVSAGSAPAAVGQAPLRQQQSTTSIDGKAGASRPVSTRDTWNRPRTEEAAAERREMVSRQIVARGVADPKVLDAMRNVPRHWFVSSRLRNLAYSDRPLPIDDGQTISQPYIVALMTESLHLTAESKVLEIGTGSGYQAAQEAIFPGACSENGQLVWV